MNKSSYIQWLGNIPDNWEVVKGKNLFIRMKRQPEQNSDIVTCFRDGVVTLRKNRRLSGFTEATKETGYQGIKKGDLVIHGMDAFAGSIGVSDSDGKSTPVYIVCQPIDENKTNNYFFAYLLRYMAISGFLSSLSSGIRERSADFRFATFANLYFPLPPLSVQHRISSYLDEKTELINRLIETRTAQIEKLKQYRAAVVSSAVTKGLNPNRKMKNSNIQWIGEIPEDWEVVKLGKIVECNCKNLNNNENPNKIINYLDISSVGYGEIKEQPKKYKFADAPSRARRIVSQNDIIISTVRTYLKSICLITSNLANSIVSTGFAVLTPTNNIISKYLMYCLTSNYFIESVIDNSFGISYPSINTSNLLSLPIVITKEVSEQRSIVSYLDAKVSEINKLIKVYDDEIEKMKNYKNSLVSAVVTGQIAV